jgi:CubicO group peptidase (beta-lactamase class C family)
MDWKPFEEFVQATMKDEIIPGLAVAVSCGGEVVYQRGFGVRNIVTREPVSPQTIFGIASVTKSFTTLAVMKLVEEGRLAVEDPVKKYLPEFVVPGVEDMNTIQIRHLLSHSTGIPPLRRRQDITSLAEHASYIAGEPMAVLGAPGEYFSYSNDAFLLTGAIIERVTGMSHRSYMTEHILKPLGMTNSTLNPETLVEFEDLSTPYTYSKHKAQLEEQPWPVLRNYEVGAGLRSCVLDLMKYGQAYFTDRIVSLRSSQHMYQPRVDIGRNTSYGYGLKITENHGGVTLVDHGGVQPGVSSNFGFVPAKHMVVAVLSNITGVSVSRIWLAAVNTCLGLPLHYSAAEESAVDSLPEALHKCEGLYQCDERAKIVVSAGERGLQVEFEGETYDLYYSRDTTFFFNYRGQRIVKFYVSESGEPWAAFFALQMLRKHNS